jgi:hypothetical protein
MQPIYSIQTRPPVTALQVCPDSEARILLRRPNLATQCWAHKALRAGRASITVTPGPELGVTVEFPDSFQEHKPLRCKQPSRWLSGLLVDRASVTAGI